LHAAAALARADVAALRRALAWMVTLARYCAIELMRRERMTPLGEDELIDTSDESASDPADRPDNFDRCIGELPEHTRNCLALAFVEGRSHEEIARLTANPVGSVKSGIRRGLISLKTCLSTDGQDA
jgi:RNA polymerase sigma-70 factor (ECF subfamily)